MLPTQLDACRGKTDDDPCTFPGVTMGACVAGVCTEVVCGNGHVDMITGEVCDDGNRISGDGCSADCSSKEICGDGIVDLFKSEECDCGENDPAPGCTSANSDNGGAQCRRDCKRARCGDGIKDPGELCDDGNNVPGDGCRADCQGRWTQMPTSTFVTLNGVFAVSENEAYAVGDSGRVLRWSGTSWTVIPGPPGAGRLGDVWAYNTSAVYVLETGKPKIWHFSGSSWTQIDPRSDTSEQISWLGISGRGPNDIWLVGEAAGAGRYANFDNGNWTSYGVSSTVATTFVDVVAIPGGAVYATDGNQLVHTLTAGGTTLVTDSMAQGQSIAATAPNHVVVYGWPAGTLATNAPGGKVFTGTSWTKMTNSDEIPLVSDVAAAASPTAMQQIAIGEAGNVMVCDGANCVGWPTPTSSGLTAVAAYGYDRAFIVGTNGTIFY